MNLKSWGFQSCFESEVESDETIARVIEERKTTYKIVTSEGELLAQLPGRFLLSKVARLERPVVGDWLVVRPLKNENKAVIQRVLPRKTLLRRKAAGEGDEIQPLAANVELTILVTSLNKEFSEVRLKRYLTAIRESGSKAAILLTKLDLAPESVEKANSLSSTYEVPCIAVCSRTGEGIDRARGLLLPAETCVFVGSSGVGKSTLVNTLLDRHEQETGELSEVDDRGRHTTTSRRLIPLSWGALVIDTPGLREIQLESETEKHSLAFAEIEKISLSCKFQNCKHNTEPGCAVKEALERRELLTEDYESYLKLQKDLAEQEWAKIKAGDAQDKRRSKGYLKEEKNLSDKKPKHRR